MALPQLNVALAKAIIDSQRRKQTIAREARMKPSRFSKILHGKVPGRPIERARIAAVLGRSERELFPNQQPSDAAPAQPEAVSA